MTKAVYTAFTYILNCENILSSFSFFFSYFARYKYLYKNILGIVGSKGFVCLCCSQGLSAILSPNTGILDWAEVARSYGNDFKKAGGDIYTGYEVSIQANVRHTSHLSQVIISLVLVSEKFLFPFLKFTICHYLSCTVLLTLLIIVECSRNSVTHDPNKCYSLP